MKHRVVETILDDFGYRETIGEDALYGGFDEFLRHRKQTASQVVHPAALAAGVRPPAAPLLALRGAPSGLRGCVLPPVAL